MQVTRPLSADDKKILAGKSQPKDEDVRRAEDELFLNILLRLNALEEDKNVRGLSV